MKKVAKKVNDIKKESQQAADVLEMCLMLDCTGSMCSWIQRSKETLTGIIKNVCEEHKGLTVKVAFVGYRDISDINRFEIHDFDTDLGKVSNFIGRMSATGGGDFPEDVQGAFNKALNLGWSKHSAKQCILICDAPGHGTDLFTGFDDYPKGSPDGFKL